MGHKIDNNDIVTTQFWTEMVTIRIKRLCFVDLFCGLKPREIKYFYLYDDNNDDDDNENDDIDHNDYYDDDEDWL